MVIWVAVKDFGYSWIHSNHGFPPYSNLKGTLTQPVIRELSLGLTGLGFRGVRVQGFRV